MAILKISPEEIAAEVRRRHKASGQAMAIGMVFAAERGRTFIVKRTPKDQGQMQAAWKVKRHRMMRKHRGGLPIGDVAVLLNDAPHAGVVEAGARPHPVSPAGVAALHAWVWRHRGA